MKRWYVLQVYAGYEQAIKVDLEKNIKERGQEEQFGEILIPSMKVKQLFDLDMEKNEQLFPGYMLIELIVSPESMRLVLDTPRVIRFLGGQNPVPLTKKEIDRVLSQVRGEVPLSTEKSEFVVGNEIEIKEGPFAGFVGIVDSINEESEKLTVMVSIFGRMTPVELGFGQVKR